MALARLYASPFIMAMATTLLLGIFIPLDLMNLEKKEEVCPPEGDVDRLFTIIILLNRKAKLLSVGARPALWKWAKVWAV